MKSLKHVALSAILICCIFGVALYSSCSKDECGGITCLNKGTCAGGICKCTNGIEGANCEIIYRNRYTGVYEGVPPDDPTSDTTNRLLFILADDTMNFNKMEVIWIDTAGLTVVQLPIELNNHSSTGSNFTITETTTASVTYSGSGNINGNSASISIKERFPGGAVVVKNLNNYVRK